MVTTNHTTDTWQPPHCPNPNCLHHNRSHQPWRFRKIGFYHRLAQPHRIQRFLCLHCKRSFSRQTFSTTYWLKLPHLPQAIFMRTVGCMANRQIARDLQVAPSTVNRIISRLGRHCLLFHTLMMIHARPPQDIVIDGFESFELSKYYPFHHHLAVDHQTGLLLHFSDSPLRRKGRMTAYQKRRREQLEQQYGRPDPQAIRKDMHELLQTVLADSDQAIVRSDDHRSYGPAMRGLECRIEHRVTSSLERRDRRNELWEVNLLDLLIRHSSANHKRETIAWSKRRQSSAERLAVLAVWRNYIKHRSERGPPQTPAMEYGLTGRVYSVSEILSERLFRTRVELSSRWSEYYDRAVGTRALTVNRRHELKYAY
jgi:transposase-like protein